MEHAGCGLMGGAQLRTWPDLQQPKLLDVQQLVGALEISPLAPAAAQEVARRTHTIAYPPNWSEELDGASGAIYFYHRLRDEASWEHPLTKTFKQVISAVIRLATAEHLRPQELAEQVEMCLVEAQNQAVAELQDWVGPIEDGSTDGPYYYHCLTGESSWEDPRENWQYDLQVRYDLLVGFLVAEERRRVPPATHEFAAPVTQEITATLTSLASSMNSMASTVIDALQAAEVSGSAAEVRWAKPRRSRRIEGSLPLPPRVAVEQEPHSLFTPIKVFVQPAKQDTDDVDADQAFSFRGSEQQEYSFRGSSDAPPPPPPPEPWPTTAQRR